MRNSSWSPLFAMEIRNGNLQKIKEYVEVKHYDVNQKDSKGNTPLILAVQNLKLEICAYFLDMGADITIKNEEGKTAEDFTTSPVIRAILQSTSKEKDDEEIVLPVFEPEPEPKKKVQDKIIIEELVQVNKDLSDDIAFTQATDTEDNWDIETVALPELSYMPSILRILQKGIQKGFITKSDISYLQGSSKEDKEEVSYLLSILGIRCDVSFFSYNNGESNYLSEDLHDIIQEKEIDKTIEQEVNLSAAQYDLISQTIDANCCDTMAIYSCLNQIQRYLSTCGYYFKTKEERKTTVERLFIEREEIKDKLILMAEKDDYIWNVIKKVLSALSFSGLDNNNLISSTDDETDDKKEIQEEDSINGTQYFANGNFQGEESFQTFINTIKEYPDFIKGDPTTLLWSTIINDSDLKEDPNQEAFATLLNKLQSINNNLILINARLVFWRTTRFPSSSWNDLFQDGFLGLLRAIEKYDVQHDADFATYALLWINQIQQRVLTENLYNAAQPIRFPVHFGVKLNGFKNFLKSNVQTKKERRLLAETFCNQKSYKHPWLYCFYSYDFIPYDEEWLIKQSDYGQCEKMIMDVLNCQKLHTIEKSLLKQVDKKSVIIYRYGLENGKEKTLEEIGKMYHLSRERIRQIQNKMETILANNAVVIQFFHEETNGDYNG
jgi:RNA polymerase primary sigma factor